MALHEVVWSGRRSKRLPLVRNAARYTLYERGGLWYVNFSVDGKQFRLSTNARDRVAATAIVEAFRGSSIDSPMFQVNTKHLYRMIERARYRNRTKKVPFDLSITTLRKLVDRCRGYCEVTGHVLDDEGPFRPSLDRIDPTQGYVDGNVRIVCLITNTAMLHYGEAAFAELAASYCRKLGLLRDQG